MIRFAGVCAIVTLVACSGTFGERAREEFHRTIDAAAGTTLHVDNIAGSITIDAWTKPSIDVRATKYGNDAAELRSVKIDVRSAGKDVFVRTSYEGPRRGTVRYHIAAPADASLDVSNVAGAITADVGRVSANRSIDLRATTGAVELTIAANSDASIHASSTVGAITSRIPGVIARREELVGAGASGRIGSGSGRIRVGTTTGAISLRF